MYGVQAIRHALQKRTRQHPRGVIPSISILINGEASKGFARLKQKGRVLSEDSLGTHEKQALWSLVNISKQGMMLERLMTEGVSFQVGHLISLTWVGKKSYGANIAHVRWIREIKHGEFRVGLEFFDLDCAVIRGAVIGRVDRINARSWHLLVESSDENRIWFPETEVNEGMQFTQYLEGKGGIRSHIVKVLEKHGNYSLCQVQRDAQEGMVLS